MRWVLLCVFFAVLHNGDAQTTFGELIASPTTCNRLDMYATNLEVTREMRCIAPGHLQSISSFDRRFTFVTFEPGVMQYLETAAAQSLERAIIASEDLTMVIKEAYRPMSMQHVLNKWDQSKTCSLNSLGVGLPTGSTYHETGRALRISNSDSWKSLLKAEGWQYKPSNKDDVQYYYNGLPAINPVDGENRIKAVKEFIYANVMLAFNTKPFDGLVQPELLTAIESLNLDVYDKYGCNTNSSDPPTPLNAATACAKADVKLYDKPCGTAMETVALGTQLFVLDGYAVSAGSCNKWFFEVSDSQARVRWLAEEDKEVDCSKVPDGSMFMACGNRVVEGTEVCDSTNGCDSVCKCKSGYAPVVMESGAKGCKLLPTQVFDAEFEEGDDLCIGAFDVVALTQRCVPEVSFIITSRYQRVQMGKSAWRQCDETWLEVLYEGAVGWVDQDNMQKCEEEEDVMVCEGDDCESERGVPLALILGIAGGACCCICVVLMLCLVCGVCGVMKVKEGKQRDRANNPYLAPSLGGTTMAELQRPNTTLDDNGYRAPTYATSASISEMDNGGYGGYATNAYTGVASPTQNEPLQSGYSTNAGTGVGGAYGAGYNNDAAGSSMATEGFAQGYATGVGNNGPSGGEQAGFPSQPLPQYGSTGNIAAGGGNTSHLAIDPDKPSF